MLYIVVEKKKKKKKMAQVNVYVHGMSSNKQW